jgi:hypothetical protein
MRRERVGSGAGRTIPVQADSHGFVTNVAREHGMPERIRYD